MTEAREMIEPGVTQLEVAEYAEDAIPEAGAGVLAQHLDRRGGLPRDARTEK